MSKTEDLEFLCDLRDILDKYGHGCSSLFGEDEFGNRLLWTMSGPVCILGALAIHGGYAENTENDIYSICAPDAKRLVGLLDLEDFHPCPPLSKVPRSDAFVVFQWNDNRKLELIMKLHETIEQLTQEIKSEDRELVLA